MGGEAVRGGGGHSEGEEAHARGAHRQGHHRAVSTRPPCRANLLTQSTLSTLNHPSLRKHSIPKRVGYGFAVKIQRPRHVISNPLFCMD